jgi:branched-chain amino acid transport system ATP-binding protein
MKSFGGVVALNGVDMEVENGSVTMIMGPNGSGKTTLINVIAGIYKPEGGQVTYNGINITGLPPHKIYELGLVRTFQVPHPFTKLTVLENLLVALRDNDGEHFLKAPLKTVWIKKEEEALDFALKLLQQLKLDHLWNEQSYTLSGGQMKLLEIGRALMSGAKVILMDEPLSGINPVLAHEIFSHILNLKKDLGITFLIVEHRLEIALQYVDYVYAMDRGKIVVSGEPKKVINDPRVIEAYLGG